MKTVILAGGFGTRISEESELKPKPMIEIGGMPILWHIMKEYSHYGFNEFIVCAGYKQHMIKEWFSDYFLYTSDVTFDFTAENKMIIHNQYSEPWRVTVINTGLNTMTGGRIKRIEPYINDMPFFLTYGDGVSDINIQQLLEFHKKSGKLVTVSAVNAEQRFGVLDIQNDNQVTAFQEKTMGNGNRINGGYMVVEPEVFKYIKNDECVFEKDILPFLAEKGEVGAFLHDGFWQCMDTKREKEKLEELWQSGRAPWKQWKDLQGIR